MTTAGGALRALRRASPREGGYSFIELIMVAAIVIVLASAVLPLSKVGIQRQKEVELRRALREMRTAIDRYKDAADLQQISNLEIEPDDMGYPTDLETLVKGVPKAGDATQGKLRFLRRIPRDPMTGDMEWGLRSYQDRPDSSSWGGQNVFDVYSKAGGKASTGFPSASGEMTTRAGRRGFTLLELMVVMALIVVLGAIAMAGYRNSVVLAQEAVLREDLYRMRDAIDQYYADKNKYPSALDALVSDGYLRSLPDDPFTKSASTWQEIPAEPDTNNPSAEPGVYNVRSGSDRTSIQGTPYSEW